MPPITRIKCLRKCSVFRDFTWPSDLPDFKRYNLIYGWNGSGKTTISRILRHLEKKTVPSQGNVALCINDIDFNNSDFAKSSLHIKVFNRDFVNDTVFSAKGYVQPIFIIGEKSAEKQKEIDSLRKFREKEFDKYGVALSQNRSAIKTLEQHCQDSARNIKNLLRSSGTNIYNNYNKANYQDRAEEIMSSVDKQSLVMSEADYENALNQLHENPKNEIPPATYQFPDLNLTQKKVAGLLSRTVTSSTIDSLKNDADLSSWMHTGLILHRDRDSAKCLFCGQKLPRELLGSLEKYFSTEYENLMSELESEINAIEASISSLNNIDLPNPAELYDSLKQQYQQLIKEFEKERKSITDYLKHLEHALQKKKRNMFHTFDANIPAPAQNVSIIDKINDLIKKHNKKSRDFQSRLESTRQKIEQHLVAQNLDNFVGLSKSVESSERTIRKAEEAIDKYDVRIDRLERDILEHRRPADDLNKDLRNYLGHDEIRLEVKEHGYVIKRGDEIAERLSEGEMTAIALLYFLKSLDDREFSLQDGVVVLDDPVSSLDANALFSAFGFIQERSKEASQLIIMTHNFTFFKQVRNWFHHLKRQKSPDVNRRPAGFYMVSCEKYTHGRCASIQWLDPLLEQYDSEYHYLFACAYRLIKGAPKPLLEQNYMLPNLARRLLESFLAFRYPQISGELRKKIELVNYDNTKKIRILRFLHTYSHFNTLGEPEHDLSLLSESHSILTDMLDLMKTQDEGHYLAMTALIDSMDSVSED